MNEQEYKYLNAAISLKAAFKNWLKKWSAKLDAPNSKKVNGKTENIPYFLFGIALKLSKSKAGKILFDGKNLEAYAKKVDPAILNGFCRTQTKFLEKYDWHKLYEAYAKRNK